MRYLGPIMMTRQNDEMNKLDVDFAFDVGESEQQHVAFHWGSFWGVARIWVDGIEVCRDRHTFGTENVRKYEVSVGITEVHSVVIEKTKTSVLGGSRKSSFRAFVDDNVVGEY